MRNRERWEIKQTSKTSFLNILAFLPVFYQKKKILKRLALRRECHKLQKNRHQEWKTVPIP